MATSSTRGSLALATAIVVVCLVTAHDARPHRNSAATSAAAATGVAAEIDSLLSQCNEQINVKGDFQKAAALAEQAWHLSERAGDKTRACSSLGYLAAANAYQGHLKEALEAAQKSLALARELGDEKMLVQALNTTAGVLGESGRYEESINHLYECLAIARRIHDQTMEYMALLNIGEATVRSGNPDRAEAPLQESLRLARALPEASGKRKKGVEMALLNLGSMEADRQQYQRALEYYEQVHDSKPTSPLWTITALQGLAHAHEQLGQHREALAILREVLPLAEKTDSSILCARLLSQLGSNQEAIGELDAALASERDALARLHQAGGNPDAEWQIERRIGHVLQALGQPADAWNHYRASIDGVEHLRTVAVDTEEGQAGTSAKSRDVYAEAADLLYDLHRPVDAFEIAERGRARAFLDMLAQSRSGVSDELTPAERERENAIEARIAAAQMAQWKPNISAADEQTQKASLATAEQDLDALHVDVRRNHPRYAAFRYPEPARLETVQHALLDDETTLIEYLLGEKRSLAWIVTSHANATVVLPPRREIEDAAARYRKLLSAPASALTLQRSLGEIARDGMALDRMLFEPLRSAVGHSRRLIIVLDGALNYLPFEALVTASRIVDGAIQPSYLVEQVAIEYGPSASALASIESLNRRSNTAQKTLLAIGDPLLPASADRGSAGATAGEYVERGFSLAPLPYARAEVTAIGQLFPEADRQIYLGADAREDTIKQASLQQFRMLHFATHGFFDEANPSRSGILLSRAPQSTDDGILQIGEIMHLKLNADLVTLSACSTGLGKLVTGEGLLGLTRGIFYAGARNVAVSLWNVNDSATATLMEAFYRNLRDGLAKDEALRRARLTLILDRTRPWQHPYYWAAFIMQGRGR